MVHFKMIHFVLVLIACVVVLGVVLIPQRLRIRSAKDEYEERQEVLNQTKRTYAQERENLQFMRTDRRFSTAATRMYRMEASIWT